jgi:hypothetical protein
LSAAKSPTASSTACCARTGTPPFIRRANRPYPQKCS